MKLLANGHELIPVVDRTDKFCVICKQYMNAASPICPGPAPMYDPIEEDTLP